MQRILSLNLNHRTRPGAVNPELVTELVKPEPDVILFNEYVDQGAARELRQLLDAAGYSFQAVSESDEYRPGRWHNQILIASMRPLRGDSVPQDGPDIMCRTNTLSVSVGNIRITGLRVPAYERAADWYAYWDWAKKGLEGRWSYRGNNGSTSRVDHVLVRNGVGVTSAKYTPEPFAPAHTDHAALLVDIEP